MRIPESSLAPIIAIPLSVNKNDIYDDVASSTCVKKGSKGVKSAFGFYVTYFQFGFYVTYFQFAQGAF